MFWFVFLNLIIALDLFLGWAYYIYLEKCAVSNRFKQKDSETNILDVRFS